MCDKAVHTSLSAIQFVPKCYKTQEMCNKDVETCLLALKFVPHWFSMSKMIEKLDNAVFSNDDTVFCDIDIAMVTLFSYYIGLNSINLNDINIDDDNFDNFDPKTINHVRLMACFNTPFFLDKQLTFDPRPKNCLSFSQIIAPKNCLANV